MSTENTNIENLKESQQIQDPVMEGLQGLRSVSTNLSKGAQDEINLAIELRDLLGEDSEVASETLNSFSGNSMYAPEAVDLGHAVPEDFGESKYDYDIKNEEDLYNLEDFRGRNQEGIYQGFNALAKIPVVFGESTLMIGNGLFASIASAIDTNDENGNGTFADWIDNPWYRYNKDLFTQIKEQLPNYRTLEEQNNEWYENLFSTQGFQNIMAGFIESTGFSLSAMALGAATAPVWGSLGFTTLGTAIAASGVGAISESLAEAVMTVEETIEEGKKAYHLEKYDQEIDKTNMDSSLTVEEKVLKQSNILDAKKQKEAQAEQELYKAASTAGISDFFGNVIVTWGLDLLAFGKVFCSTDFDLARRTNKTLKNADRAADMARTAENTIASGRNKGSWFKKASNRYDKKLQTDASKMKIDPKTGEYKDPTKLDALKSAVKSGRREGTQELFQSGVASGSTFYGLHADGPDTWLNSEFNQMKGDEESSLAWASVAHGLAESFLNPEAYQEFMGGFLMGAGGMLTLGKQNNSGPQTWLGKGKSIGISGGLFGNIAEINRYKGLAQIMNKFNKSSLGEYVHRANTFNEMSNGWVEAENKFEFKNYQDNDLFNIVNAYIKAGRLQDLKDMVNTLNVENLSDQDLESIATFMESQNEENNSSLGYRDNEGNIDKEEVKKQVNKNIKAFNDVITSYENSITDVRNMLGKNSLDRDEEATLAWLHYKAYNSGNRIDSIVKSLREDDIWNKLPDNVEINVGKGKDKVTYNLTKGQIVNSFYNGNRPKTEEEYNKTKSKNDPEYKYSADYILSHAWDQIVEKVVGGIADDSVSAKKTEIFNSLKDLEKLSTARTQFNLEYFKYLHNPEMLRNKRNIKQKAQEFKEKLDEKIKNKKEEKEETAEIKKTPVSGLLKQYNQIKEDDKKLEFIRNVMFKNGAKGLALQGLIEAQKNLIDAIQSDTNLTEESKAIIIPIISTWAEKFDDSKEFLNDIKNLSEDSDIGNIKKEWIPNIKQAAEKVINESEAKEEAQKNIDSTKREEKEEDEEDDKEDNSEEEDEEQTIWDIISKIDKSNPEAYENIRKALLKIKNMFKNEQGIKQFKEYKYSHNEGETKVYNVGYPVYKDSEGNEYYIQFKTDSDILNTSENSEFFFPMLSDSGKIVYFSTHTTLAEFKSEVVPEEIEDRILSHVLGTTFSTAFVDPYLWMFSDKDNKGTFKSDFIKALNDFFDAVKKATNTTSTVTNIPDVNNTNIEKIIQKHIQIFKADKGTTKTYNSFKEEIIKEINKKDSNISNDDIEKLIKEALEKEDLIFEEQNILPSLVYPEATNDLENIDFSNSLPDKDDYKESENNTGSGDTLNYWKSSISEIPIHPNKGEMIPYHLTREGYERLKNNPKLLKLHAVVWQICKDKGMFDILRGSKTPTKGEVTFTILAEAQKKLQEPVTITVDGTDITLDTVVDEPVVFYKDTKGQILGVLAFDDDINNPNTKQQKGLKEFKEAVKTEYQKADKNSDFDSEYKTTINTVHIGKILFGNNEKAVINISKDAANNISVYTKDINKEHSIFVNGEQKTIKESDILFFKGIKKGQAFLIIPCSGKYKYRAVPLKSKNITQVLNSDSNVKGFFNDLIEVIKTYVNDDKIIDNNLIDYVNIMCDLFNIKYKHTINKSKSGTEIYISFIKKIGDSKEVKMLSINKDTDINKLMLQLTLEGLQNTQGRVVLHRKNNQITINGNDYEYNDLISEIYYTNLIEENGNTIAETVGNWVTLTPLEKEGTEFKESPKTQLTDTEKRATPESVAASADDNKENPSNNSVISPPSSNASSSEINIDEVNKILKTKRKKIVLTQEIINKLPEELKEKLKRPNKLTDKIIDNLYKIIKEIEKTSNSKTNKRDAIEEKVNKIIKNSPREGQFSRDSKRYTINGRIYNRVHDVKGSNWTTVGNSTPDDNRVNAGNDVDLIGRETLSSKQKPFKVYEKEGRLVKLTDDAKNKTVQEFEIFKNNHPDEKFFTENLIVYGKVDRVPIAGELDCISINKNTGEVTIYDFKTSQNSFDGEKFNNKYHSNQTASTKQDYTRQLLLYAKLLEQNYDIKVNNLVILGMQLQYKENNVANKVIAVSDITEINLKDEITEANEYLNKRLEEFDSSSLFREKESSQYEEMNRQREIEWLSTVLPQFSNEQRLHFVDKIENTDVEAWGAFKRGLIFITDTAAKGTIYHEAFHAVTDCLLTPQEYQDLLQEGRKMYPDPNLSDLDIEEKLAEDFRVFVELMEMAEEDMTPKQLEDYKRILSAVKNLKGEHGEGLTRLEAFYWNIHRGKFANRTLNENLNRGKKDALIEYEKEINAIKQKAIEDGTFMKAPNGKPTNLNEQQWLQVRTKAFKIWFGDWEILAKQDVLMPIGTSGSGKSTWIKSLPNLNNYVIISPDEMRVEFTGDMNNKSKDDEIYQEAAKRAIEAIKQGKKVIFDTTNLKKDRRTAFTDAIYTKIPNAKIAYKLMPLNAELAKQRIKNDIESGKNRANVSPETIDRHAASYLKMLEDIKTEKPIIIETNNISKVVDENGEPKEVYHGTNDTFYTFDISNLGSNSGDPGDRGAGFYFGDKDTASFYGSILVPVFLNIRNPYNGSERYSSRLNRDETITVSSLIEDIKERFDGTKDIKKYEEKIEDYKQQLKDIENDSTKKIIQTRIDNLTTTLEYSKKGFTSEVVEIFNQIQNDELSPAAKKLIDNYNIDKSSSLFDVKQAMINEDIKNIDRNIGNFNTADGYISDYEQVVFSPNQIKSATDNIGLFDSESDDVRFRLIGEIGALNADKAENTNIRIMNLITAKAMALEGKSSLEIKQATGWEKGVEGKWKLEEPDFKIKNTDYNKAPFTVDDEGMHFKLEELLSGEDYLNFLNLKKSYTEFENLEIVFKDTESYKGYISTGDTSKIVISKKLLEKEDYTSINETLVHELQHLIQNIEGFARGSNLQEAEDIARKNIIELQKRQRELESYIEDITNQDLELFAKFNYEETEEYLKESKKLYEKNENILKEKRDIDSLINQYEEFGIHTGQLYNIYKNVAGEVEARTVSKRSGLSYFSMVNSLFTDTMFEDVVPESMIVLTEELKETAYSIDDNVFKKDYHQEIQDYYEQKWAYVNLTQEQKQVLESMGINPRMYDSLSLEEKEVLHYCRM